MSNENGNFRLPKGKSNIDLYTSASYWGYDDNYNKDEELKENPKKCECGTTITYGNGPEVEYLHVDFCPLYKERPK